MCRQIALVYFYRNIKAWCLCAPTRKRCSTWIWDRIKKQISVIEKIYFIVLALRVSLENPIHKHIQKKSHTSKNSEEIKKLTESYIGVIQKEIVTKFYESNHFSEKRDSGSLFPPLMYWSSSYLRGILIFGWNGSIKPVLVSHSITRHSLLDVEFV